MLAPSPASARLVQTVVERTVTAPEPPSYRYGKVQTQFRPRPLTSEAPFLQSAARRLLIARWLLLRGSAQARLIRHEVRSGKEAAGRD